jgi:hypothetical protein
VQSCDPQFQSKKTFKQKAIYLLCCSHGVVINEKGAIGYDGDDDGPSNVVKEQLKREKMPGHSKKG